MQKEFFGANAAGSLDPYCRAPRSRTQPDGFSQGTTPDDCKSSIVDQVSNWFFFCTIMLLP